VYRIKDGIIYHKCDSCGAKDAVDMEHKLTTFIINSYKKSDRDKEARRRSKIQAAVEGGAEVGEDGEDGGAGAEVAGDKEKKEKKKKKKKDKDDKEKKEKKKEVRHVPCHDGSPLSSCHRKLHRQSPPDQISLLFP
jgi:translation initiation factor 5